jgi:hypothetical protein
MASKDLSATLKDLSVDDLFIDNQGRIVINNPAIVDQLRRQDTLKLDPAAIDNVGCCENLAQCGKLQTEDVASIRERLVQRS